MQVEANPQNLLAGAGLVGAGLLAFHNVNKGNGDVSVNPTLGLNYNHATKSFAPTLGANVQVGGNHGLPHETRESETFRSMSTQKGQSDL